MCKVPYWAVTATVVIWMISFVVSGELKNARADLTLAKASPTRAALMRHTNGSRRMQQQRGSKGEARWSPSTDADRLGQPIYLETFVLSSAKAFDGLVLDMLEEVHAIPFNSLAETDPGSRASTTELVSYHVGELHQMAESRDGRDPRSVPSRSWSPSGSSNSSSSWSSARTRQDTDIARTAFSRGERAYHEGRYTEAEAALISAVKHDIGNAHYFYVLAMTYHQLGQMEKAQHAAMQAVRLEDKSPIPHRGLRLMRYQGYPRVWIEQLRSSQRGG